VPPLVDGCEQPQEKRDLQRVADCPDYQANTDLSPKLG
jgi:hypothetical protein